MTFNCVRHVLAAEYFLKMASELASYRALSPPVVVTDEMATGAPQVQIRGAAIVISAQLGGATSMVPHPPREPRPAVQAPLRVVDAKQTSMQQSVSLPPLTQVAPTRVAERKRQIQVLHKARLRQASNGPHSAGGSANPNQ